MAIHTEFTKLLNITYPIIGAPMFLVSNSRIVSEVSEAGGIGVFPTLNYRTPEKLNEAFLEIRSLTKKPIGVNIIVNKGNRRQSEDLKISLHHGAEFFMTSLGSPKEVIDQAHKNGAKVFCDVVSLEHALKVQDQGADGVVAVSSGAGGHAGSISPLVLVPWLKSKLKIPVVAAGGIATGSQMAAAIALGASAVSIGTRFIASEESEADFAYKKAILESSPEDVFMTARVSGTPASIIKTEYTKNLKYDLPLFLKILKNNPVTKKYIVPLIYWSGSKKFEKAALQPTWKTVWSAGQSVGLINEILSCKEIINKLIKEYEEATAQLPKSL